MPPIGTGNDHEQAAEDLVRNMAPRKYSFTKMEPEDMMDFMEGEQEGVWNIHVQLFEPKEREVWRVNIENDGEEWKASQI